MHGYVCKHNVDEKKIVLVPLNWSFSRTDMFGSHNWEVEGGGGGGTFSISHNYWGDVLGHIGYFTQIHGLLVFFSFHVGLMKCMLSSFQLLP